MLDLAGVALALIEEQQVPLGPEVPRAAILDHIYADAKSSDDRSDRLAWAIEAGGEL